MRKENSERWSISVCGLNCAKCDIYSASHGDEKALNEIKDWFKQKRNKILKPEQIRCEGCKGSLETHWSSDCKMLLCAKKRGHEYCFECAEFPCVIVNEFASDGVSHHKRTVENARRMKEIGLDAWIAEQERKGQCVFCP